MTYFVGRTSELQTLEDLTHKKSASLAVIKGRRRIGKSRLVEEFAKKKTFFYFTGIPPTSETTPDLQREEFVRQLHEQFKIKSPIKSDDWGDIFALLAKEIHQKNTKGPIVVMFDEISWMGSKDPVFLGKLKVVWDMHFSKIPNLILILCGSVSIWIEKNILSSTGFIGRIRTTITLKELNLDECNQLLTQLGFKISPMEKFMILGITGGVPWYIEQFDARYSVSENIRKLCFDAAGTFVDEFKRIFDDLFEPRRLTVSKEIVEYLSDGSAEYEDISTYIKYPTSGSLSDYIAELVSAGFVGRDNIWNLKTGKVVRSSSYRIKDNYVRFYLKYIQPHLSKIEDGQFTDVSISSLPGWDAIMGLQFENIVLSNRSTINKILGIHPEEIICSNPYFQHKTLEQEGCQIDYLIQTRFNNLYVCEIKFSKKEIQTTVIKEVQNKIENLKRPKGFACIPILIHVNGASAEVEDSGYFGKIIDFSSLLN